MKPYIVIIFLEYIFSLIFTREFYSLCAQGRVGQAQHLFSWRRISQSEIRNSAAAKARAGREFLSPQPPFLPAPARAFSLEREACRQFRSKKVRAKCIITAPKLTLSELTAPRGEYAALRRAKSAFVFAVKSQSSPQ